MDWLNKLAPPSRELTALYEWMHAPLSPSTATQAPILRSNQVDGLVDEPVFSTKGCSILLSLDRLLSLSVESTLPNQRPEPQGMSQVNFTVCNLAVQEAHDTIHTLFMKT